MAEVCASCGEAFSEERPPHRFEVGPLVGQVAHEGECEANLALELQRRRFERRPGWQRRLIRRAAGAPPPWER